MKKVEKWRIRHPTSQIRIIGLKKKCFGRVAIEWFSGFGHVDRGKCPYKHSHLVKNECDFTRLLGYIVN